MERLTINSMNRVISFQVACLAAIARCVYGTRLLFISLFLCVPFGVCALRASEPYVVTADGSGSSTERFALSATRRMVFNTQASSVTDANGLDAFLVQVDGGLQHADSFQLGASSERVYLSDSDVTMKVWYSSSAGEPIAHATELFFPQHTQKLQLVEWRAGSALFTSAEGIALAGTGNAHVYVGGTEVLSTTTTTSSVGVFEVPMPVLEDHVGESLVVIWMPSDAAASNADICLYRGTIPYLSNSTKPLPTDAQGAVIKNDVVVLEGYPLTLEYPLFKTVILGVVTVNANAKLTLSNKSLWFLGVDSLIIRANAPQNKYGQLYDVGVAISQTGIGTLPKVYFDYELDAESMYTFAAQGAVSLSDISFQNLCEKNSGTGDTPALDKDYYIDYYDGSARAATGRGFTAFSGSTLSAMTGYTIAAEPQLWGTVPRTTTTLRIPVPYLNDYGIPTGATLPLVAYGDASTDISDRGWNFLGNPFLTAVQGAGTLQGDALQGDTLVRYYTVPSNRGIYAQVKAEDFALLPFHAFFVQTGTDGSLVFYRSHQALLAPARYRDNDRSTEHSVGISLTDGTNTDQTELLIGEAFDDTYEINADLAKWSDSRPVSLYTLLGSTRLAFQATSPASAQQPLRVGYRVQSLLPLTFSAMDLEDHADYAALYLYDRVTQVTTNLLLGDYTFTPASKEDNGRFTLSCIPKEQSHASTTEVDGDNAVRITLAQGGVLLSALPVGATVQVYDRLGRLCATRHASQSAVQSALYIPLPQGVYLLQITVPQGSGTPTQVRRILVP